MAIAESRPGTEAQLLAISGVGRGKLDTFGADVLDICANSDSDSLDS